MLIIKDVFIPHNKEWKRVDIGIKNGIITEIASNIDFSGSDRIVDFKEEAFILPSMIDPHVHVREPGYDYKEDWSTCSKAALKGGVGAIFDMPNNREPVDRDARLEEKRKIAFRKSYVNFGLHIALTEENADKISSGIYNSKICGVKIYMSKTTGGLLVESEDAIKKAFYQNKPVLVHTGGENGLERILNIYKDVVKERKDYPVLYICHVSKKNEIEILAEYKNKFKRIYAEVTPHHLFLNRDNYRGLQRVLPPLEGKEDNDALLKSIEEGIIDIYGTDHAPHTVEEKKLQNPPAGFPGLETAFPLLFDIMMKGKIGLNRLIEITSKNSASVFGINNYGLNRGSSANLTVFIKKDWYIGEDGYETKCGWSPFDGYKIEYKVGMTIINGKIVYQEGEFFKTEIKEFCCS